MKVLYISSNHETTTAFGSHHQSQSLSQPLMHFHRIKTLGEDRLPRKLFFIAKLSRCFFSYLIFIIMGIYDHRIQLCLHKSNVIAPRTSTRFVRQKTTPFIHCHQGLYLRNSTQSPRERIQMFDVGVTLAL